MRSLMLNGVVAIGCLVGHAVSADEAGRHIPDDALLEFLGTWETADGEWLDPLAVADIDASREATDVSDGPDQDRDEEDKDET